MPLGQRERERERERDRQTDRQTDKQTGRQTKKERLSVLFSASVRVLKLDMLLPGRERERERPLWASCRILAN